LILNKEGLDAPDDPWPSSAGAPSESLSLIAFITSSGTVDKNSFAVDCNCSTFAGDDIESLRNQKQGGMKNGDSKAISYRSGDNVPI
jgi:hypothetical protein